MEFSIKFGTVKSGRSIIYIKGSHVTISIHNVFLSLQIDSVLTNSADPDEMPPYAAFHLGLPCFPKYQFRGFWSRKGS